MGSDPITVGELGERGLIERIKARIPPAPPFVLLGIGDDAAVIEPAFWLGAAATTWWL